LGHGKHGDGERKAWPLLSRQKVKGETVKNVFGDFFEEDINMLKRDGTIRGESILRFLTPELVKILNFMPRTGTAEIKITMKNHRIVGTAYGYTEPLESQKGIEPIGDFMINDSLNRAISAMNNAGFEVVGFSWKEAVGITPLKLKVIPVDMEHGGPDYKPPGFLVTEITGPVERDPGETCNLQRLLGASNWRHALSLTQEVIRAGKIAALNVGDFVWVKFDVPAASHDGVEFPALHVDEKVIIINVDDDKVIFNFDDIIFQSAINDNDKNEGGFSASALAKYLNNEFLDAMGISDMLLANHDGLKISLPTTLELFGDKECWAAESNYFEEPHQIKYFKNEKNRMKSWENETDWYWTTASALDSPAAWFYGVTGTGFCASSSASVVGGVAPVFCVA
jgi:hypothetical protein